MESTASLRDWFSTIVAPTRLHPSTKAYVVGVMTTPPEQFGRRESLVLAYAEATGRHDFASFQRIADFVLWADVWCPEFLAANQQVVESIGRLSYHACYRITRGSWSVYEELADGLPAIVLTLRMPLRRV